MFSITLLQKIKTENFSDIYCSNNSKIARIEHVSCYSGILESDRQAFFLNCDDNQESRTYFLNTFKEAVYI